MFFFYIYIYVNLFIRNCWKDLCYTNHSSWCCVAPPFAAKTALKLNLTRQSWVLAVQKSSKSHFSPCERCTDPNTAIFFCTWLQLWDGNVHFMLDKFPPLSGTIVYSRSLRQWCSPAFCWSCLTPSRQARRVSHGYTSTLQKPNSCNRAMPDPISSPAS